MINIYPFELQFNNLGFSTRTEGKTGAFFPYLMNGNPVNGISCFISFRDYSDRLELLKALGAETGNTAYLKQIHSRITIETDNSNLCTGTEADGLVTRDQKIFLSVTVADCLPIYLYDTETSAFGLLHSGWKGTGIVINALELMKQKYGTRPEAVAAVFGPCIQSCCYRVDEERARLFEAEFGRSKGQYPLGPVTISREDGYYLNMQAANASLLADIGVKNISVCRDCTFTDSRLGSFRREGENFTRMIAMTGFFKD